MNKSNTTLKIATNTAYQLAGKATTMAITVLATLIITRLYGREAFGKFSLMQGWPALFFIIVDFGLNAIATRELSKDFSKAGTYLGNILILRITLSSFFIAFLFLVLAFFPYSMTLKFGIALSLYLILTQSLYATANIIFQTKLRYDFSVKALLCGYFVILFQILLFSYLRLGIMWLSFSYVIGGVVTFIISMQYLGKLDVHPNYQIDWKLIKSLVSQTLPTGIMFIFSQINFKVDEILISILNLPDKFGYSNTESVAIYSLPYKIFEVFLVVPTFFMNSSYPVLVRHLQEGKDKLKKSLRHSLIVLWGLGLVVSVVGIVFAPLVIKILGGTQFNDSVLLLRILLAGLIVFFTTQPLSWTIVILDGQKHLPYIYLVAAVFNIVANLVFIPKYSYYAAAVITNVSELLILLMLTAVLFRVWRGKGAE